MLYVWIDRFFSETPGPRHRDSGSFSAEELYDKLLAEYGECFDGNEKILLDFSNTAGVAASFLDELVGKLVLLMGGESVTRCIKWNFGCDYIGEEVPRYIEEWEELRLDGVTSTRFQS